MPVTEVLAKSSGIRSGWPCSRVVRNLSREEMLVWLNRRFIARLDPHARGRGSGTRLGSHNFQRLEDHGVALRFHLIALLHAEGLIEDCRLQSVGDELALRQPLDEAGPDLDRKSV